MTSPPPSPLELPTPRHGTQPCQRAKPIYRRHPCLLDNSNITVNGNSVTSKIRRPLELVAVHGRRLGEEHADVTVLEHPWLLGRVHRHRLAGGTVDEAEVAGRSCRGALAHEHEVHGDVAMLWPCIGLKGLSG